MAAAAAATFAGGRPLPAAFCAKAKTSLTSTPREKMSSAPAGEGDAAS
jgi:hypothetical protein